MLDDLDIFSKDRLLRYKIKDTDTKEDILNRYLWNIKLSEACYPALSIIEVALRNRIDAALSYYFGQDWLHEKWEHWPLKNRFEKNRIIEAKAKLKNNYSRGHLIAELNFGFWIGLFRKQYKPIIWNRPKLFEIAFPAFDKKCMDRVAIVFDRLEKIRILRNRISHHEPIFDMRYGVVNAYEDIEEVIYWLSPQASRLVQQVSRFQAVFQDEVPIL